MFNAIPKNMKSAVSVGIGLFIAFIGMQNAGIVVNEDSTLVALGNVKSVPVALAAYRCNYYSMPGSEKGKRCSFMGYFDYLCHRNCLSVSRNLCG